MRASWRSNGLGVLLLAVAVGFGATGRAEEPATELQVVPGTSSLGFKAHTTFHDFEGKASKVSGWLRLVNGRPAKGRVSFPVTELRTAEEGRDKTMWGPQYLDSAKYGTIEFTFESLDGPDVPAAGDATGTVHGSLRVKERSLPVGVPVTYRWKAGHVEISGSFPLDIRKVGLEPPVVAVVQRMDAIVVITFALDFSPAGAPVAK